MFSKTLRILRESKKMTQEDLAKILGTSAGSIGNYEQGSRMPRNDTMKKIAEYFNVSVDYLLGYENEFDKEKDKENVLTPFTYAMHKEEDKLTEEQKQTILNMVKAFTSTQNNK